MLACQCALRHTVICNIGGINSSRRNRRSLRACHGILKAILELRAKLIASFGKYMLKNKELARRISETFVRNNSRIQVVKGRYNKPFKDASIESLIQVLRHLYVESINSKHKLYTTHPKQGLNRVATPLHIVSTTFLERWKVRDATRNTGFIERFRSKP